MKNMKKFTTITKTFSLLAFAFLMLGADYITPDMIPRGTDVSTVRCDGGLISIGDFYSDVLKKCGKPMKETRISGEHYRVLVYRLGKSGRDYGLAFLHEKLQRIYYVRD
jgi:hypothetical protein